MDLSNPYVVGVLCGIAVFAVFLLAARFFGVQLRRKRKVLLGGDRGLACPSCGTKLPAWRAPKNLRQAFLGGWTCAACGDEFDRKLDPVPKDVAAKKHGS
ncbi:MAG: hypothetical protein R3F34_05735 [Planctomycetota bacterium]